VRRAVRRHGTEDAEALSEATCLPLWNVRRALSVIQTGRKLRRKVPKIGLRARFDLLKKAKRIAAYLKRKGETVRFRLERECHVSEQTLRRITDKWPESFAVRKEKAHRKGWKYFWKFSGIPVDESRKPNRITPLF